MSSSPPNNQAKMAFFNAFDVELKRLTDVSNSRTQQGSLATARMSKYLDELNKQLNGIRILSEQLRPKFEELKREIAELRARLEGGDRVIKELQEENARLEQENKRLVSEKQALEAEKRVLEEKLQASFAEIERLKGDISSLQHENAELAGQVRERDQRISSLMEENGQLKERVKEVIANIERCEAELQTLKTEKTNLEGQIQRLNLENEGLIGRIIKATAVIRDAVDKIQSVSPDNPANEKAISDLVTMATDSIAQISNAIQGIVRGGRKYKKSRKSRKNKKRFTNRTATPFRKKSKKIKGGFTYRTTTSFKKKSTKSYPSSSSNRNKKKYKKKYFK